jgi:hypothetical protein
MWDPRRLTTLWTSAACCRDSFTLFCANIRIEGLEFSALLFRTPEVPCSQTETLRGIPQNILENSRTLRNYFPSTVYKYFLWHDYLRFGWNSKVLTCHFARFRRVEYNCETYLLYFVMSVFLSVFPSVRLFLHLFVHMKQLDSHGMDFRDSLYLRTSLSLSTKYCFR